MTEIIEALNRVLKADAILVENELLETYSRDYTENLSFLPDIVVLPENTQQVADILKICDKYNLTLTPRGAGTGLSGGCLPVKGGIVLSTERMNKILSIDVENFQATVQSGVINEVFRNEVEKLGLYYPPDPASKGSCFLGGNIAHNSGGPKAVKYGVTRDYVLNLEIVLANGDVIWTGSDTLKNSTGYSLTHLMIGSEGTLGIVTQIVFRLVPKPTRDLLMLASFKNATNACKAVSQIFLKGVTPSALELMEDKAMQLSAFHLGENFDFKAGINAYLLIEVDGFNEELLMKDCELIAEVLEQFEVDDILFADNAAQKEKLWKIRRAIGEKVKAHSIYKEEDTVVKRAHLPELLSGVKAIGEKYGFESICYGHAGDGNLHVNIIKGAMSDEAWNGDYLKQGIREIFRLCKTLGGTISGEHGIGWVQKEYMNEVFEENQLDLMRQIKKVFDPKGILNPSKIIPEHLG
jgi:glycolate oxidase